MIEEWNLLKTNMSRLSMRSYQVAVIPTGAVEPHNRHLPEGQDCLHTTYVASEVCRRVWEQEPTIVCLPTIPYGVDCNLLDFPLAIHVTQATLDSLLTDIIVSLHHHEIRKILILNGHGGNDFVSLIRQLQCELDVHLFLCDWWTVGADQYEKIFEKRDDHAGEMETSVALALYPELVELAQSGSGIPAPFRFEALNRGWVRTSRSFARLNDHCAAGDPSLANAEKGRQYLQIVIERISAFLMDLARSPIDDSFPHKK